MDTEQALKAIRDLADGTDPWSGKAFPADAPYQHPDTVRALYLAAEALEEASKRESRTQNAPPNAGKPWSKEEEARLAQGFDQDRSIEALAQDHGRTPFAIQARLEKLGKIEPSGSFPPPQRRATRLG
jgi:hypothetical protein